MKIRFTVTLTDETVAAFTAAGFVTNSSIVSRLSEELQAAIARLKAPLNTAPDEDVPNECDVCGKVYDPTKSKAHEPDFFCSRKCEKEAADIEETEE